MHLDLYATLPELRRLDGLGDATLFPDSDLIDGRAFAVEKVQDYTGMRWGATNPPPVSIRWAVRTLARQYLTDLHARLPDRATSLVSEFGQTNLAQAGGVWRPTSLPEVNAVLNAYRERAPFG
ncbi:hypothetical protein NLX83_13095 [Allokutzneria sp. A3M-2-11 16]|uniref:hypothetical protein n=1 Tax=Allokutzneria sp. A3M-2-11 16 TaxID=2962043 RepID=UPI0020B7F6D3|nr:hypothetical protein [Allokutzneria sp. A3M-2-11 16]MCP3800195.1 hypothetical protein [Allokutzneria sp. A3M-2-11 16]